MCAGCTVCKATLLFFTACCQRKRVGTGEEKGIKSEGEERGRRGKEEFHLDVNMFTILGPELADFPQRSNCDFICVSWRRQDAFTQRQNKCRIRRISHPGCKRRRIFSFAPLPLFPSPHSVSAPRRETRRQTGRSRGGETVSDLSAPS